VQSERRRRAAGAGAAGLSAGAAARRCPRPALPGRSGRRAARRSAALLTVPLAPRAALLPPPPPPAQVEADIRPFRGLLLGLFFVSVGSSINMDVLREEWEVVAWMLAGLVSFKAAVNIALGPLFGLSRCAGRGARARGWNGAGGFTHGGAARSLGAAPPACPRPALPGVSPHRLENGE
jgi:hypothetical protein